MASEKRLRCHILEFGDKHKAMIADALQAAVDEMPTKHQPTPKTRDSNDAAKNFNSIKSLNAAAPLRVAKNIFTNGTQFPTATHLLSNIGASGSFVTLTDMTQDALQDQQINIDSLRDVEAVKELEHVQQTEQVDVKVELDFEEEFAKLPNHVETNAKTNTYFNLDYKTEFVAETLHTGTQHKAIDRAHKINKNVLGDIEMLQEFINVQDIEIVDVKAEHQIDIEPEFGNECEPKMVSTTSHTDIQHKDIDDLVDFEAELTKISNPVILKAKEKEINKDFNEDDDETLPTATKKLKYDTTSKPTNNESLFLFICPECNYHAKSYDDWKNHTNDLHLFNTVEKINMRSVKTTVDDKLGFKCRKCSAHFSSSLYVGEEVITHHISHLPFQYYIKCLLCEQKFNTLVVAKRHLRLKHPDEYCVEPVQFKKQTKFKPSDYVSLYCPTCNKKQRNYDHWTGHLSLQHNFFEKCRQQFKHVVHDQYECNKCLKRFKKTAISGHSLTHEPYVPFQCTFIPNHCKFKTFTQRAALDHVRHEHITENNYINCEICNAIFDSVQTLKCHIKQHHNKSYGSCQTCKNKFANIKQLFKHIHSDRHKKKFK